MFRLSNSVKDYAWGSTDAIAQLLGVPPSGAPQAELWIGAHPSAPSHAQTSAGPRPLNELISGDPVATLGEQFGRRPDPALPFLLKILSAAKPLSLQVHPTREQAQIGYAAEQATGVPLDAAHRNYKDRNHKPELLLALTPFEALCGFRHPAKSAESIRALRARTGAIGVLDDLLSDLENVDIGSALRGATARLLQLDKGAAADAVSAAAAACDGLGDTDARTVSALHAAHPGDAGVLLALLLNRVTLAAGEAMYLPAGNMHAYLGGTGVEIMATSDNVLRGGLTGKHVDVAQLLAVTIFAETSPDPHRPAETTEGKVEFAPPVEDFRLTVVEPRAGRTFGFPDPQPRTAIVLEGFVTLDSAAGSLGLGRGQSVFIPASDAPLTVRGDGRLVVAAPGKT